MCQISAVRLVEQSEAIPDDQDSREDVCLDCRFSTKLEPLACRLITKRKQVGRLPCPQLLAIRLATKEARCPSPDKAVAELWANAAPKPIARAVVGEIRRQATADARARKVERKRPPVRGISQTIFRLANRR